MKFLLGRPLFSDVYECKKGVEIGLPICVLCHLAKYRPWHPEEYARMPSRPRPEAAEETPRRDIAQRVRMIERWLHHAEEELLYTPDAAEEAAAPPLDARYYLCWGGGVLGVLAIMRFPMDARHPVAQ
jgi:hypothetical protein